MSYTVPRAPDSLATARVVTAVGMGGLQMGPSGAGSDGYQ